MKVPCYIWIFIAMYLPGGNKSYLRRSQTIEIYFFSSEILTDTLVLHYLPIFFPIIVA